MEKGVNKMSSYVITRSDDYLAHHGIKGQKWGERRFQNPDGSLTPEGRKHYGVAEGGSSGMSRKFNRAIKKLNKLRDRTDVNIQRQKAAQYDKRAKTGLKVAGVGAAIAGAGAAAEYGGKNLREQLVSKALNKSRNSEWNAKEIAGNKYADEWIYWDNQRKSLNGKEIGDWNKIYDHRQNTAWEGYQKNKEAISSAGVAERNSIKNKANLASQIHKGVMAAGAAVAVVGGGMAAYNKIQSGLAKRRMTDVGHDKAVAKYNAQVNKMMEMFKDTPYSNLVKKAA
jgi:hypothetical protein